MAEPRTYLDYNATAPLRQQAREAMIAALDLVGNASSVHAEGRRARGVIETAREQVAALVGAKPEEVVFTSGATEANNWVMRAGWDALYSGATEHESVLVPARAVYPEVVELACNGDGVIDLAVGCRSETYRAITPQNGAVRAFALPHPTRRALLSLQLANPETGVVQPIEAAVATAHEAGLLIHTDAVQAVGRVPVDFNSLGVDFMSISAHKLGGPKGAGALIIRDGLDLPPLLAGGGQERRRRSGTENIAAIAGFGAAAAEALSELSEMTRVAELRDRLEAGVLAATPAAMFIGAGAARLPNTSCIASAGAEAATLLIKLDLAGIAISAGSACSSGKIGGSHVLAAMGIEPAFARSAIRVSIGAGTTAADIERFVAAWDAIHRPRAQSKPNRATTSASAPARPLVDMSAGE